MRSTVQESDIANVSQNIETTEDKAVNEVKQESLLSLTEEQVAQTKEISAPYEAEQRSEIASDNQTISLFIENERNANIGDIVLNEKTPTETGDTELAEKSNGFFNNLLSKVTGSKSSHKKKNKEGQRGNQTSCT